MMLMGHQSYTTVKITLNFWKHVQRVANVFHVTVQVYQLSITDDLYRQAINVQNML